MIALITLMIALNTLIALISLSAQTALTLLFVLNSLIACLPFKRFLVAILLQCGLLRCCYVVALRMSCGCYVVDMKLLCGCYVVCI